MDDIKVTVVKFGDREHLQMQYRDPITGRKKTRSTKTTTRREAEREAAKWESELRKGRSHDGGKITWSDFRDRYENEVLASLAKNTDEKVGTVFNTVERIINPSKLRNVTAQALSGLMAKLREEAKAESTIKGLMAHLLASLRWAVNMGLLSAVPKVQMPKRAKKSNMMKGRSVTGEEFDRMLAKVEAALLATKSKNCRPATKRPMRDDVREKLAAARSAAIAAAVPSWQHYLRGLWTSGLRLEESLELYWDRDDKLCVANIDGKRPMLRIPAELEKGNQDRLLPMAPEFARFLRETPADQRIGPVFNPMAQDGTTRLTSGRVSRLVSAIGKAAGVKVSRSGKLKFASAHDLRRSFGERWSSRVMPQQLMELMRHESIETTMRYYVGRNAQKTADILWEAEERASNTASNTTVANPVETAENLSKSGNS
jgi:integrase